MNRDDPEKVTKGLECCQLRYIAKHCDDCPYHRWLEPTCRGILVEDALAVINALTEENERLRAENEKNDKEWREIYAASQSKFIKAYERKKNDEQR